MSRSPESEEIKRIVGAILESVGIVRVKDTLYEGGGVRIVLRCRTKPDPGKDYGPNVVYSFGVTDRYYHLLKSVSQGSTDGTICRGYVLLSCQYNGVGEMPVSIYLIPADFITGDNIKIQTSGEYNDHKFHLRVYNDDWSYCELQEEDKSPRTDIEKEYGVCAEEESLVEKLLSLMEYEVSTEDKEQRERELLEDFMDLKDEKQEVLRVIRKRYPGIVERVKRKYNSRCQICGFTFEKRNGGFYSEGHHFAWVSKGGAQKDEANVVVLCPNHHRMLHHADVEIGDLEGRKREVKINGVPHFIVY